MSTKQLPNSLMIFKKQPRTLSTQSSPYSQTPNISPELRQLIAGKRRSRSKWQQTHYLANKIKYNFLSYKLVTTIDLHPQNTFTRGVQYYKTDLIFFNSLNII
jgi:hypothetical protein